MELREFLEQRISDDERIALAAPPSPWEADGDGISSAGTSLVSGMHTDGFMDEHAAVHAARHDPARVLRDVAAARMLLDFAEVLIEDGHQGLHLLAVLAAPYAEHPSYRQEWSP